MRTSHNFHASAEDFAIAKIGGSYRCIDISDNKPGGIELTLHFPNDVPAEKLGMIADLINDALDTVRAQKSEAA